MTNEMIAYKYKKLIEDFINEIITVEEFERDYLNTFKNETERMGGTLFEILNGVFEICRLLLARMSSRTRNRL